MYFMGHLTSKTTKIRNFILQTHFTCEPYKEVKFLSHIKFSADVSIIYSYCELSGPSLSKINIPSELSTVVLWPVTNYNCAGNCAVQMCVMYR